MTFAIIMDLIRCINIPLEDRKRISRKGEFEETRSKQVFEYVLEFALVIFIRSFNTSGEKSNRCLDVPAETRKENKLGCGVVKSNGLGLRENLGFLRRANFEKIVRSWRGCHSRNSFREISNDLRNIRNHVKRDTARSCEIGVHTQVVMDRTTGGLEGFIRCFVPLLKPSSKAGDNIMILMANKEVIDMPADG